MKFPVLWSGITHSVLGAPVNTTCYIITHSVLGAPQCEYYLLHQKDCELRHKAVWQSPPQSVVKRI